MGLGLKRKGRRRCVGVGGALFPVVVGLTPSAQEQGMVGYGGVWWGSPLAPRSRAWSRAAKLLRV